MSRRKTYLSLFFPVLFLAASIILRQIYVMGREWKLEKQSWNLMAESTTGEISEETLKTMCMFPGLEEIWPVISAQAGVKIEGYSASAEIRGVDLSGYPLEIVQSSGKKSMGMSPLLAAGEDFFDGMQDRNGGKISDRQKKILLENYGEMKAEVSLNSEFGGAMTDAGRTAEGESMAGGETGTGNSDANPDMGEFLGIVKGDGLYMEQEQMKRWLEAKGIRPRVTKVCMRICGKKRAEQARSDLEKAGFVAELFITSK